MDYNNWHNISRTAVDDWRYADETGKIVGWIINTPFTSRAIVRTVGLIPRDEEIGEYLTIKDAKKAIEVYFSRV